MQNDPYLHYIAQLVLLQLCVIFVLLVAGSNSSISLQLVDEKREILLLYPAYRPHYTHITLCDLLHSLSRTTGGLAGQATRHAHYDIGQSNSISDLSIFCI